MIDPADPREYAWLLVRSGTLAGHLVELWQTVPVSPGSVVSKLVGYPLRLVVVAVTGLVTGALMLAMVLAAAVTPVALFTLVEPWLPDAVWWTVLGAVAAAMGAYLLMAVTAYLHIAARGEGDDDDVPAWLRAGIVAEPVTAGAGWRPDQAMHVSHEFARRQLFASGLLVLGIAFQFAAVVGAQRWFTGPVDGTLAWALFFARSLFDTALLGIPSAVVPSWSAVAPAGRAGEMLMVGVDLCFAAGLLTLVFSSLATGFKVRELFNGTTRDLADYLHGVGDATDEDKLMIHRVAVVRPLDEAEVVSMDRKEFFARMTAGAAAEAP